jgi:hypothetical protein
LRGHLDKEVQNAKTLPGSYGSGFFPGIWGYGGECTGTNDRPASSAANSRSAGSEWRRVGYGRWHMMRGGFTGGPGVIGHPIMMRMIFALMDTDGDGTIELQEFQAAHERIFKAMDSTRMAASRWRSWKPSCTEQRQPPRRRLQDNIDPIWTRLPNGRSRRSTLRPRQCSAAYPGYAPPKPLK